MGKKKILLTPEIAQELLKRNYEKNRTPRLSHVREIIADIKGGRWNPEISHYQDPILISKANEGAKLINGQHRCMAVIQSGIPVETYIEYDVPISLYYQLDSSSQRTAADFVNGINKKSAAAIAKVMLAVEKGNTGLASALEGRPNGKDYPTRAEIIEKCNSDNEIIQRYIKYGIGASPYLGGKRNHFSIACYIIDFCEKGDSLERFCYEAAQMATSAQQINAMRAYLGKTITNRTIKTDRRFIASVVLTAYDAFADGKEIKQFNKTNYMFSRYEKYMFDRRKTLNANG